MDINLVVICGRLASVPEVRVFESGERVLKLLVTVTTDKPRRRLDVLPVEVHDPSDELIAGLPDVGQRVWVTGTMQRRMIDNVTDRRTRIVIVADQVTSVVAEWTRPGDEGNAQGVSERAGGGTREGDTERAQGSIGARLVAYWEGRGRSLPCGSCAAAGDEPHTRMSVSRNGRPGR